MSAPPVVIAIDLGTQSVRALAFDARGTLLDKAQIHYPEPWTSPEPGLAEQDPEAYWRWLGEACQALWAQGNVRPDQACGVAMTFQRGTFVCLDADDEPVRPAVLWLDQRRAPYPRPPAWLRAATWWFDIRHTLDTALSGSLANWMKQFTPDDWSRTHRYVLLSGFVTHRMTGEHRDALACQVGQGPFDYRRQAWESPRHWSWRCYGVGADRLQSLVPPTEPLGTVTAAAAAHTGLPPGTPVFSAGSDKACEVLGSGCVDVHEGCVGLGTTATLNVDGPDYLEPVRFVPAYPSVQPGRYHLEHMLFRGMWLVTWFKEQLGHAETLQAERDGVAPEALLEAAAAAVPAGSEGVVLLPTWSPGVVRPGPEARGAIIGLGGEHRRAHLYRALLEGLAYGLREGRDFTVARSGTALRRLVVCGGGSQSDLMMQILADVFGMTASRARYADASGLGAAIAGAVGLGWHPDLRTAVRAMTSDGDAFEPIPAHVERYDALYREAYRPLYGRLAPLYRSLTRITGQRSGS